MTTDALLRVRRSSPALVWTIARRKLRDTMRDWRIVTPIVILTLVFPWLMNWTAQLAVDFVQRYDAPIVGDRLVPFLLMIVGFFPVTFSLIIGLETFVGEKERRSIEPLLSMPISDLELYLGKMLRLDVNAETYRVPDDNPFLDDPAYVPEAWAMGLRNPWRFSFDRATGDLYIGDVGQWRYEEVDFQPASSKGGENYGWSAFEASHPYLEDETVLGEHTPPILEYGHEAGLSVTGGYVYRGERIPALQGVYLYGDWCSGTIWSAAPGADGTWQAVVSLESGRSISSFGEDEAGELYLVDYDGAVLRFEPVAGG